MLTTEPRLCITFGQYAVERLSRCSHALQDLLRAVRLRRVSAGLVWATSELDRGRNDWISRNAGRMLDACATLHAAAATDAAGGA